MQLQTENGYIVTINKMSWKISKPLTEKKLEIISEGHTIFTLHSSLKILFNK